MSSPRSRHDPEDVAEPRRDVRTCTSTRSPRTAISSVEEVLALPSSAAAWTSIAITDHERIDAAVVAQRIARGAWARASRSSWARRSRTRNGHLRRRCSSRQRIKPWGSMRDSGRPRPRSGRPGDRGPSARALPAVRLASGTIRRLLDEADPRHHPDAIEAFNPTTARMRWSRRVPAFVDRDSASPPVASSDAHRRHRRGHAVTLLPGARPPTTCARPSSTQRTDLGGERRTPGASSWACSVASSPRTPAPCATRCVARCCATAPVGTWGTPAAAGGRPLRRRSRGPAEGGRRMKIGLVTPYIYPLPGGVNAHVQELYENLVVRGHDVRIISSTHGPQRRARATSSAWATAGACPPTARSARSPCRTATASWSQEMLDREQLRPAPLPRAVRALPVASSCCATPPA